MSNKRQFACTTPIFVVSLGKTFNVKTPINRCTFKQVRAQIGKPQIYLFLGTFLELGDSPLSYWQKCFTQKLNGAKQFIGRGDLV